jgi:hypothetical protein
VGGGRVAVGEAQATRIAIEKRIQKIRRTGLRITIPPFDLGIPQIIHLKYYSTFLGRFQQAEKVILMHLPPEENVYVMIGTNDLGVIFPAGFLFRWMIPWLSPRDFVAP